MEPGRILAHCELGERIGKGGMGEVYRARDTKLGRDVALKLLPPEYAADPERLARFEREAKVLASLHHPNIASIFGFEKTPEATFLVMELVDGEDLAEVLRGGPLPVDDAVAVARQVAEGLEEAHEKGIVHRDLKPANVKRTPEGKVKVLDFGLARAFAGQSAGEEFVSSAPTMTAAMTQVGAVIGTAAYMSPEQARGKEVDRRADIWAFGVILFEMLTGRQAFVGETASDTLAGILKSEPDWSALPDGLPFQVERVLRRCLEKDPRQRLRDIGEARVRLEDPAAESGMFTRTLAAAPDPGRPRTLVRILPWAVAVACLAVAGWFARPDGEAEPTAPLHVSLPSPEGVSFHLLGSFPGWPEISPDGERIVFSGLDPATGEVNLYLRSIHEPAAVLVGDTRSAQYPFWSPDSRWIAYYIRTEGLMKAPVDGGPSQKICDAGNGKGGSWNQFGDVLLTLDYNTSLYVAPAAGGEARPVTDLASDTGFNSHRHPQFLPDGRRFLYFARGHGRHESEIRMASLDGDSAVVVVRSDVMGYYASGRLLYMRNGDLVAQELDTGTGRLLGSPQPLVNDVMTLVGAAKAAFSVSQEGSLVHMRGAAVQNASLVWKDRTGQVTGPIAEDDDYGEIALSPDGRFAAAASTTDYSGTWDIWIIDLERDFRSRFTTSPADEATLVWSRNSRTLYFTSDRRGKQEIFRKALGSPGEPELIYAGRDAVQLTDVTADEGTLLYRMGTDAAKPSLYAVDLADTSKPRTVWSTEGTDFVAKISPDGRWVAFATDEPGIPQVFLAPWPALAPVTQVSTSSGTWFQWTRGGSEIIFQEITGMLVAVPISFVDGEPRIGQPENLFNVREPDTEGAAWAVTGDGERFAVIDAKVSSVPEYVNLVIGWPLLLKDHR